MCHSWDRVVSYAVRSDKRINISERVAFDFLACECLACESFNFVSRKNSYHVLRIHDFQVDLERCPISDDWSQDRDCDFDLLTRKRWSYVEVDTTAISICLRYAREKQSRESRRWERLTWLYFDVSHSVNLKTRWKDAKDDTTEWDELNDLSYWWKKIRVTIYRKKWGENKKMIKFSVSKSNMTYI
jgi:hypothetical protein